MTLAKNKVFVAGHNGMVGSAIVRKLSLDTSIELVLASRSEVDLLDAHAVARFFDKNIFLTLVLEFKVIIKKYFRYQSTKNYEELLNE